MSELHGSWVLNPRCLDFKDKFKGSEKSKPYPPLPGAEALWYNGLTHFHFKA